MVRQDAYIATAQTGIRFWVEAPSGLEPSVGYVWQIHRVQYKKRELVNTVRGFGLEFVPEKEGSYIITIDKPFEAAKVEPAYLEVFVPHYIKIERKGKADTSFQEAKDGLVMVQDLVRYSLGISPPIQDHHVQWYIDQQGAGVGLSMEVKVEQPGKTEIGVKLANSPHATSKKVQQIALTKVSAPFIYRGEALLKEGDGLGFGEEIRYRCYVEPAGLLAPEKVKWYSMVGEELIPLGTGFSGTARITRAGRLNIIYQLGSLRSKCISFPVVGAYIVDSRGKELAHVNISKWPGAFDKKGGFRPWFLREDPDAFYICIDESAGLSEGAYITARTVFKGKQINPPVKYVVHTRRGKLMAGPCILVADEADDRWEFNKMPDDSLNDPTLQAVLGGELEISYTGVTCGMAYVGRPETSLTGIDPIRHLDLNIVIPKDPQTGTPFVSKEVMMRYLRRAEEILAQANLDINIGSLQVSQTPTSRILILSGIGTGVSEDGQAGYLEFWLDGHQLRLETRFGEAPSNTIARLLKLLPPGYKGETLGPLVTGDRMNVTFVLSSVNGNPKIKIPRKVTDLRQSIRLCELDLSNTVKLSVAQPEFTLHEVALIMSYKDPDPTTIDVIVTPPLQGYPEIALARAYPYKIYPGRIANTILISRDVFKEGKYPYLLAKMLGHLLLLSLELAQEPWRLMSKTDAAEVGVQVAKRFTLEEIKKIRQNFTPWREPKLLKRSRR
jgi:hypothetical protein